jgi:hypothetical protein
VVAVWRIYWPGFVGPWKIVKDSYVLKKSEGSFFSFLPGCLFLSHDCADDLFQGEFQ